MSKFTNADKLKCVERELRLRYRVYERRVDNGEMTRAQANREIGLMEEIAADYRALAEKEMLPLSPSMSQDTRSKLIEERSRLRLVADNGIAAPGEAPQPSSGPQSPPDG